MHYYMAWLYFIICLVFSDLSFMFFYFLEFFYIFLLSFLSELVHIWTSPLVIVGKVFRKEIMVGSTLLVLTCCYEKGRN